jgi:hypothetical protein
MAPSMQAAISSDHLIDEGGCKRRWAFAGVEQVIESINVILAPIWSRCGQRGNRVGGKRRLSSVDN